MTTRLLPVAILIVLSGCCIPPLPRFLPPGQLCLGLGPTYRPYSGFAAGSGYGLPPVGPAHGADFAAAQPMPDSAAVPENSGAMMFGRRWRTRPPGYADSAHDVQPVGWHPDHSGQRLRKHAQRALRHQTGSGCECKHCERRRRAAANCGCERCRRSRAARHHGGRHSNQPAYGYGYSDIGLSCCDGTYGTDYGDCIANQSCTECAGGGCISGAVISNQPFQNDLTTGIPATDCNCLTHSSGTTYYPHSGTAIDGLPVDATQPELNPVLPQRQQQFQQPPQQQPVPKPRPLPAPPAIETPSDEPPKIQPPMPEPASEPTAAAGIPMTEWVNLPVEELSMNKLSGRKATSIRKISYEMIAPFEAEEVKVETDEIPGQRVILKTIQ